MLTYAVSVSIDGLGEFGFCDPNFEYGKDILAICVQLSRDLDLAVA